MLPRARGLLALLVGWCFTLLYCAGLVLLNLVTLRRFARELVAPAAHAWARVLLALLGARVLYENPSTLSDRRARVVVINHPSTFDVVWGALIAPPAAVALGKLELVLYPGINVAWWALRFAWIDRSDLESARRTLAAVGERARRERLSVLVAPEGTRSRDGTLQPFKKGAFHLAMEAELPIYPVVASGAYAIWPRRRWLPVPGLVRIRFLPPVETRGWRREEIDSRVESVRSAMRDALAELERAAG